jgi:hypothetical protein
MRSLFQIIRDLRTAGKMPQVTINLMAAATKENDPFYERIVREFFEAAQKRHGRVALIRSLEYGVAVCRLPRSFDEYFMAIDAAGRRNVKKARRLGYVFGRIQYNEHLDDVREIRRSTDVRQGKLAPEFLDAEVTPCADPPSRTNVHDYAYFGVIREGRLRAYAACLISGELCMIEHILGHAAFQGDGIVPMLIVGIAREMMEEYPRVKFYAYGTFFGCSVTLKRFKRKFLFEPHRVRWALDANSQSCQRVAWGMLLGITG